ncbi:MAG: AraC family transcriptional regulator [Luteolibacter sp.]|jgi:AraC-like DNA-binding protein/quercetin dioxygenase-like cupin family protein
MSSKQTQDIHRLGRHTRYRVVVGNSRDDRPWLNAQPSCPVLAQHHIAHVGLMEARKPFEVVRHDQSGTYMMACEEGEGQVLVDGNWQTMKAGQACLLPPFVMNSFRCESDKPWKFTWVRYQEDGERQPILFSHSPVMAAYDDAALRYAVEGLRSEAAAAADPGTMQLWVDLIQSYVMRFAEPYRTDDRLARVWSAVDAKLGADWTLAELAQLAAMSEEHLRRLCKQQLGRSPMQHVIFLRMHRASYLLATTEEKVETIARAVGYRNPFTFSTTFKKWVGWRPSDFRARGKVT